MCFPFIYEIHYLTHCWFFTLYFLSRGWNYSPRGSEKNDREILNDKSKTVEKIEAVKQKSITKQASKVDPKMTEKVAKIASPIQKLNTKKNIETKEERRTCRLQLRQDCEWKERKE